MVSPPILSISCHCGAAKQTVHLRDASSAEPCGINLCHCSACRHNTGLLCVSYADIKRPSSIEGLVSYRSATGTSTRFFCAICGCHVFRRREFVSGGYPGRDAEVNDRANITSASEQTGSWAVATGVIIGSYVEDGRDGECTMLMRYANHINTAGTKDGGLSVFLPSMERSRQTTPDDGRHTDPEAFLPCGSTADRGDQLLDAFCHCKTVRFHITRPNEASKLPRSNFPDLMIPYVADSPQIHNPEDEKWWLRPGLGEDTRLDSAQKNDLKRYLAGTCACRSCRLISGFEIQTWAFVPRANIFFHVRGGPTADQTIDIAPLDFATLPHGILTSYESKEGVRREFCPRCGATVFWRDRWRPELVDVSVGLLDAAEGARAETWLDWWTERVSFSEDAGTGREGETAERAKGLIRHLEEGLRAWGQKKKDEERLE